MSGSDATDPRLLLLSADDNVLVAREEIAAGEAIWIGTTLHTLNKTIQRGHKVARRHISPGEKILKYGAPIGSAITPIACGDHVHVFNIKSDYTATHLVDRDAADAG